MTKINKKWLLTSVAAFAFSANSAYAFDEINWTWNNDVTSEVNYLADITLEANPTGLVQIEKIQTQTGDVNASSVVSGVHNNAATEGGTLIIDESFTVSASYDDPEGAGNTESALSGTIIPANGNQLTGTFEGGQLSEQANGFNDIMDIHLTGEFDASELGGSVSATDLPMVESAATAVGNNQAIDSTVSIALDDAQTLDGNVTATSSVSDILNAAVDSSATAVGNNMAVTLADSASAGDNIVLANIEQTSNGSITAASSVTDVTLDNYTGFGDANMGGLAEADLHIPMVSSVATAVGNNLAISVGGVTPPAL